MHAYKAAGADAQGAARDTALSGRNGYNWDEVLRLARWRGQLNLNGVEKPAFWYVPDKKDVGLSRVVDPDHLSSDIAPDVRLLKMTVTTTDERALNRFEDPPIWMRQLQIDPNVPLATGGERGSSAVKTKAGDRFSRWDIETP
ncbi:MAG TPA: hypothetical protein VL358_00650 [Caulobacteraceae bacterium]|jgi:hypothetical protein|nr:hypothetical protein [Caulobacteraceae bacterium]